MLFLSVALVEWLSEQKIDRILRDGANLGVAVWKHG
jgi:hypothetical protein